MKNKRAFTQELAELITKYELDTYCKDPSQYLAGLIADSLEKKARVPMSWNDPPLKNI